MDQRTSQILFALLRSAIRGTKLTKSERESYSVDMLQDLLKISAKHDVIHLLVFGLKQNELISNDNLEIEKHILKAVYRCERLSYEYDKLCDALEKAQIPFLPLKGSVIRKYYREAWMRTSCDIDILVHESNVEKCKALMVEKLGYKYEGMGPKDVSMYASPNTHVELHYSLIEDENANKASALLKNVWNYVKVREGFDFWYEMPDEIFYFYHIAHMAKHIENGGCGIRPFIDLCILETIPESDTAKRNALLEKGDLLKFADVARGLSRVWFENEEHNSVSMQMEEYVLSGGVYGNSKNRIIIHQQKKGGRIKYALSKIFVPYDVIKFHYPILQKHRWLTPIMEIRRWCKLIFGGHLRRTSKELKYNISISNDDTANIQKFLSNIGL